MMLGYAQYGYLMTKTTPSADVEDDDGKHPPGTQCVCTYKRLYM
jgi:hypothetical protein